MNTKTNIHRLAVTAIMLGLAATLSVYTKFWHMPMGGSITLLSMLPVTMIAISYGTKWGLSSAFAYSLIQLGLDFSSVMGYGLTPESFVGCIAFDYIIAFTGLGLAGLFKSKGTVGICTGVVIALVIRLIAHIISGTIIFGIWAPEGWSPVIYAIAYNGTFMLPEIVTTAIGAAMIFRLPQMKSLLAIKA